MADLWKFSSFVSPIGAGGMEEMWKARDTRLDRGVAIKVLPAEFAENAQLRTRFEREAKTISQLNHPHICTLYDVGGGYLVMELLEGQSLAERLERGPLPLADVVRYGAQIAEALDRAHRAGIVHRDLKPGNIMITKSGVGTMPRWSHKGNEIFYFTSQGGTLMAAGIRLGDSVEVELPRQLFTVRVKTFLGIVRTQYDVAPDDQHFLVNVTTEEQAQTPITLYQNWLAKIAK